MAVRNFWVDADVGGRETTLGGGPRAKDGGMDVTIYQRDDGQIKTAVRVICRNRWGDELVTDVFVDGVLVSTVATKR